MFEQNNILLVTVLGLITIAGIGYTLYRLKKQHPGMKMGALVSAAGVDNNEIIMIIIMMGIYIAEAVVSSTITVSGEAAQSPLGRFMMHMGISVLGAICGITFWRDMATCIRPNLALRYRLPHIFVTLCVGWAALYIPIINTGLIAANLGQDMQYELYRYQLWADISPFTGQDDVIKMFEAYGLPPNYNPKGNMLAIMKVSLAGLLIHYIIIAIEGGRNIASPVRQKMLFESVFDEFEEEGKKKDDEKKDDKKEEGKKGDEEKEGKDRLESNIRFLLSRWGYRGDELVKQVKAAIRNLDSLDQAKRLGFTVRANNLRKRATINDDKGKSTDASAEDNRILDEIKALFSNSPKETDPDKFGLGLTLKGRKK